MKSSDGFDDHDGDDDDDLEQALLSDTERNDALDQHDDDGGYVEIRENADKTYWSMGLFGWVSFAWITPVLQRGAKVDQLHLRDLPPLPESVSANVCGDSLLKCWEKEISSNVSVDEEICIGKKKGSLLQALFRAFGWQLIKLGGLKFLDDGLSLLLPMLLHGLLGYLESPKEHLDSKEDVSGGKALLVHGVSHWEALVPWASTTFDSNSMIGVRYAVLLVLSLLSKVRWKLFCIFLFSCLRILSIVEEIV